MERKKTATLNKLENILNEIITLNVINLISKPEHKPYDFEDVRGVLEDIDAFCRKLIGLPLEKLSESRQGILFESADQLLSNLHRIRDFHPLRTPAPDTTRSELGRNLVERFEYFVSTANNDLPYLLASQPTPRVDEYRSLIKQIKDKGREIDEILVASQKAAGEVGVSVHSSNFKTIAEDHEKSADKWLKAAIAFIAAAIVFSIFSVYLFPVDSQWSSPVVIQRIVIKVAVLLTIYFLISQSIKNYRVHRHLFVVNQHRETSLNTFQTFVKSAESDPLIQSQILMEAAKTIFTPVQTGYIASDDDNPSNRIVEILKLVKEK